MIQSAASYDNDSRVVVTSTAATTWLTLYSSTEASAIAFAVIVVAVVFVVCLFVSSVFKAFFGSISLLSVCCREYIHEPALLRSITFTYQVYDY